MMKNIELNAEMVLRYLQQELSQAAMAEVEEKLLQHPKWLEAIELFKKHEAALIASTESLNEYFVALLHMRDKQMPASTELTEEGSLLDESAQLVAYVHGELSEEDAYRFEELLLHNPALFEQYEGLTEALEAEYVGSATQSLDVHFEQQLQATTTSEDLLSKGPTHRFVYPTLIRWAAIAASAAAILLVTRAYFFSPTEPSYEIMGATPQVEMPSEQQAILNTHNTFQNRLERLLMFGAHVSAQERQTFATEVQALLADHAFIEITKREKKVNVSFERFMQFLEEGKITDCQLKETEIVKPTKGFFFFSEEKGYKVTRQGEIFERQEAVYGIEDPQTEPKITKVHLQCQ